MHEDATPALAVTARDLTGAETGLATFLSDVQPHEPMLIVVDLPQTFSRMCTYRALDDCLGSGQVAAEMSPAQPLTAFLDLSLHPEMPAQTIIQGGFQDWPDLADGLPEALAATDILVMIGYERLLALTPHRLSAFLTSHARERVVVVLATDAWAVCDLPLRDVAVRVDRTLHAGVQMGEAYTPAVQRLAHAVTQAAVARAKAGAR